MKSQIYKNRLVILLQSLAAAYGATVALLLLLAFLLLKLDLDGTAVAIAIAAVYVAACFVGGFLAGKKIKEKKFFWGLVTGALYFLLLLALSIALVSGSLEKVSDVLSAAALCAGGGTLGGMLS